MSEKFDRVKAIADKLHKINFDTIIKCDKIPDTFAAPEIDQDSISDYCRLCDNICFADGDVEKDSAFHLCNISHGTHTIDFLSALKNYSDYSKEKKEEAIREIINSWNDTPVMFVLENPSRDYGIYDYVASDKAHLGKRPAKEWYWIRKRRSNSEDFKTDTYLVQQEYGRMVETLIHQFGIGNAYMTNIIKCGLSDTEFDEQANNLSETSAKNTGEYPEECIKTCVNSIFEEEVKALYGMGDKPIVFFAFGKRTYRILNDFLEQGKNTGITPLQYLVYQMPHPASRLRNDYRKYVLKGIVREAMEEVQKLGIKSEGTMD